MNVDGIAPMQIKTKRVIGTKITIADTSKLAHLFRSPFVAATLWPDSLGGPRTTIQTQEIVDRNIKHWDTYGYGVYCFREITTGEFVGRAGLQEANIEGEPELELLYAIAHQYWDKGFASEISSALIKMAFSTMQVDHLVAFTLTTNYASQRVMQKAGFDYVKDITHAGLPHVLYRVDKISI